MNISGIGSYGGRMPDMSAMTSKLFQKADADGNKEVSFQEFEKAGQKMPIGQSGGSEAAFKSIDTDSNGSLSKDEMSAFGERMSSQMQGMMLSMQSMLGGGMKGGEGMDLNELFKQIDGDEDDRISRSEFDAVRGDSGAQRSERSGGLDPFKMLDADEDGLLTREEIASASERGMQAMKSGGSGNDIQAELMQAIKAYKGGSNYSSGNLAQELLQMLNTNKQGSGITA